MALKLILFIIVLTGLYGGISIFNKKLNNIKMLPINTTTNITANSFIFLLKSLS